MPSRCEHGITHILLAKISEFGLVEKISADDPPSTDSSLEAVALSASVQVFGRRNDGLAKPVHWGRPEVAG
jgi:hypothetical protein